MRSVNHPGFVVPGLIVLGVSSLIATHRDAPPPLLHIVPAAHHARRYAPPDADQPQAQDEPDRGRRDHGRRQSPEVRAGMENLQRLLPLSKELSLRALSTQAPRFAISPEALGRASADIDAVRAVTLDRRLHDMAEFDDERPHEIRVGPDYAQYLDSDEAVLMLLGHELTHSAAQDENLVPFFNSLEGVVQRATTLRPSDVQGVELGCDFIGEQVVRQYIDTHPTREAAAARLARALEMDDDEAAEADTAGDADTSAAATDADDDAGDDEHLGHADTMTALRVLDPDLNRALAAR